MAKTSIRIPQNDPISELRLLAPTGPNRSAQGIALEKEFNRNHSALKGNAVNDFMRFVID